VILRRFQRVLAALHWITGVDFSIEDAERGESDPNLYARPIHEDARAPEPVIVGPLSGPIEFEATLTIGPGPALIALRELIEGTPPERRSN
jgi:hypothetical protein